MSAPLGPLFSVTIIDTGTLTGDQTFDFKLPWDAQLVAVSADCDTNDAAILVGTTADPDAYVNVTDGAITDGTILLLDAPGDFVDDQYPHIVRDTLIRVTMDHTGSNPTDFFAVLWFSLG